MSFSIENPNDKNIKFSVEIDEDGGFTVFANGHLLMFIEESSGELWRARVREDERNALGGLEFDSAGRIKVNT
jgi:hypothetical protein